MNRSMIINMIKEELAVLAPVLTKELSIPETTYTYEYDENNLASCHATTHTRVLTIVDIEYDKRINFNPEGINNFVGVFPPCMKEQALKYIIRHCIFHEHRHAWQYTHNKQQSIKHHNAQKYSLGLRAHGESEVEMDANDYAISMAKDELETIAFKLHKTTQCMGGTFNAYHKEYQGYYLKLAKAYTLPKVAKATAITVGILGTAYLLKTLIKKRK